MNALVAVLFLAVAAHANEEIKHPLPNHIHTVLSTDGEQYKLYEKYTRTVTLTAEDQKHTFDGLNLHAKDDFVDKQDLDIFFWHEDLHYAVPKFIKFIDDKKDGKIYLNELDNDFKEIPVRIALIECHYLKSPGLKQSCFADQLLTYASLVLDAKDVHSFYEHIGGTDGISVQEAENIIHPKNKDKKATAEELGAYHGNDGVSKLEFTEFVTQESINDDFRRCRKGLPDTASGNVDFKNDCLLEELVEYCNDDLTEMDVAVIFHAVDTDGKNGISKAELGQLPGVKGTPDAAKKVDKIVKLLDMSLTTPANTEPVIDFGEFRTYMRTPTVLLQLERECIELKHTQKEEMECVFDKFVDLILAEHDTVWMVVPDLEQQIAFEIFDTSNDGEIRASEITFADKKAEERLIEEMDHDKSEYVCLEEWNEYLDIPHMIYGTGDCLLKPRSKEGRGHCYPTEVEDIMDNIKHFDDKFWAKWFKFYDSNGDNVITVIDDNEAAKKFGCQDLEDLFLSELGQGDNTVTLFEFKWYVKQQELADRYEAIVNAGNKDEIEKYHDIMMRWIQDDITEYDTEGFFDELDVNDDHDLDEKDFGKDLWPKMKELLKKIDGVEPNGDAGNTVNFREFWLWLNYPTSSNQEKKTYVKDIFEKECTQKIYGKDQQKREIECYAKYFNQNTETLSKLC